MSDHNNAITKVIADVEQYYDLSFQMWPERSLPAVFVIVEDIERICSSFTAKQTTKFNGILHKVLNAMEAKDYVRMRDYLYYDLRELLHSFQSGGRNKKIRH